MTPTIGILKPGSTYAEMIVRFGDYDAWFMRALAGAEVAWRVHAWGREAVPAVDAVDGWIVTGARSSVREDDPAVERLLAWLREAVAAEVPLLGVCYGHQALCRALGGEVALHPGGWELGTVEVTLTDAGRSDPLFDGLPDRFAVQATHEDDARTPPPGATLLATNAHSVWQAMAVGPAARGVQFHPEVDAEISADFVARRRHLVEAPPVVEPTPLAARVLENWVARFVGGARLSAPPPSGRSARLR